MIATKKISLSNLDELKTLTNNELYSLVENKLDFIGLVAMIDPPRETSKESIRLCLNAGIKPIMITGDNINTAISIAKELGIYHEGDLAIEGNKLKELSDEELFKNIDKYSVYARAIPEDKIRIVHA
jgi:cation-transporting P-type ATPase